MKYMDWLEKKYIYYKILYIFYAIITVTCIREIPYLPSIFSKVMLIISFVYFCVFFIRGYYFKMSKIRYFLLIFLLLQMSSFFISNYYAADFISIVINTIFFFIISMEINTEGNNIQKIFIYIVNIIFPIVVLSLITYYFKLELVINDTIYGRGHIYEGSDKVLPGITVNVNTLGILCSILIIISIHLLITDKFRKSAKIYFFLNILIGGLCLFYTKARGALLMLGVYLFCMGILKIKSKLKAIVIASVSLIVSSIIMVRIISVYGIEKLSTGRSLLWSTAAEVIKENPIWGVGTTAFVDVVKGSSSVHLPGIELGGLHNIYIQIATANGCITLIVFMLFILSIIILGIKKFKFDNSNNKLGISLLAIIIAFLALSMVESSILYIMSFIGLLFWICIGKFIDMI